MFNMSAVKIVGLGGEEWSLNHSHHFFKIQGPFFKKVMAPKPPPLAIFEYI